MLDNLDEEVQHFEQALAIRESLLGTDYPLTLGVLNNLGVIHNFMGEPKQARIYFEQALRILAKTVEPNAPEFISVQAQLAELH